MVARPVYGIIFDLMGTLAAYTGTRATLQAAWDQGARDVYAHLARNGFTVSPVEYERGLQAEIAADLARSGGNPRALSMPDILARALAAFDVTLSDAEMEATERVYCAPELAQWEILPGAFEAVETLNAEGYRLAVVSNAPSHVFVEEAVAKIGLRPFFSPVMSSARAGARKPDPRLFRSVTSDWQLDPRTVVVVGDGLAADIAGAHAAGMRGILVHGEANADNALDEGADEPDAILARIADLPMLIEQWHTAAGDDARPETGFVEDF